MATVHHVKVGKQLKGASSGGSNVNRTEGTRWTNRLLGGKDQELFEKGYGTSEILLFELHILFKYI